MFNTAFWTLAIGVLIQNVWLQHQLVGLRAVQAQGRPAAPKFEVGRRVVGLTGVGLDGKLKDIRFSPTDTSDSLVITFSGGCPICLQNLDAWQKLSRDLQQRGWPVYWVSRDASGLTRRYAEQSSLPEKLILSDPSYYTYTQLDLQLVPRTIVVAPGGIVRQVWTGSLKPDVVAYFHLSDSDIPNATSSLQKTR